MNVPALVAADAEPCASCAAPLAADQRYCLACGSRLTTARLPFLEILREDPGAQLLPLHQPVGLARGPVAAPPADLSLAGRARAYSGLIAGVGVLLLAMLIGVLLGTGSREAPSAAVADQKPIVVNVGGGAPAPASTGTAATGAPTGAAARPATSRRRKAAVKATIVPRAASPQKLQGLSRLSGRAYQKQVDKLGKNIAVGGKAPPKDNKAPAAGGSFQEIG